MPIFRFSKADPHPCVYSLFPYFMKIAFDLQVIYKTSIKNTQYL